MNKVMLPDSYRSTIGSHCLDGSGAGYFIQKGTPASANKWVFFFQGGGACVDEPSCKARAQTVLGSSLQWPNTLSDNNNVLSDSLMVNPDFYTWNHVHVPYCTGDVHIGSWSSPNPWGLFFSGYNNMVAIVTHLRTTGTLNNATEILISGGSAGGLGTFHNTDYFFQTFTRAKVRASPQGGWFMPNASTFDDWSHGKSSLANDSTVHLWKAQLHPECVAYMKLNWFECISVDVMYSFLATPVFVVQNQFDTNQIFVWLGCPRSSPLTQNFIEYYGDRLRLSAQQIKPQSDGAFLASCLEHTANLHLTSGTRINSVSYSQALGDWYFNRKPSSMYIDHCPDKKPCNPKCA